MIRFLSERSRGGSANAVLSTSARFTGSLVDSAHLTDLKIYAICIPGNPQSSMANCNGYRGAIAPGLSSGAGTATVVESALLLIEVLACSTTLSPDDPFQTPDPGYACAPRTDIMPHSNNLKGLIRFDKASPAGAFVQSRACRRQT